MVNFKPHSQKAFLEINDMLDKHNRCIYVSATGTEKSLVAAVTFRSRGYQRPLVLAPSKDILNQWKKHCPEVAVMTYQKFCHLEAADIVSLYDFIILDEVHHADSPVWGQPVRDILQNTDIPVLGLTATPRRYSDGGKDVSESLFDNHRVDGPDPGEAIASGILPGFLYVSALFGLEDIVKECKEQNLSPSLVSKLEFCIRNTGTVIDVLHRDMPPWKRKAVVFCEDISSIPEAVRVLKDAYPQQRIWVAHSLMKKGERFSAVSEFAAAEEGFIITVDIFNEGMHVDGVNTGIMFRRTQSPTIYIQQMGRCLTPGNQDVVFFDFVGNCASVKDFDEKKINGESALATYFGVGPQKEELPSEVIVKSYIAQSLEILQRIKELLSGRWTDKQIDFLKENYTQYGSAFCAGQLGKTKFACKGMARRLGLVKHCSTWTSEQIDFLKENYTQHGPAFCAEKLGRTNRACKNMAQKLGFVNFHSAWTSAQIAFLKENYALYGSAFCAEKLGKTKEACATKARNLGLTKSRYTWASEQVDFLKQNYAQYGPGYCAEKLDKTNQACQMMAHRLGLEKTKSRLVWTSEQITFLTENYTQNGPDFCATALGRTSGACYQMALKLGLKTSSSTWTSEQIAFLKENYAQYGSAFCAEKLGRTNRACAHMAQRLGLTKSLSAWTSEQIVFLRENYIHYGPAFCAEKLGRTNSACRNMAQKLGLSKKKTPLPHPSDSPIPASSQP